MKSKYMVTKYTLLNPYEISTAVKDVKIVEVEDSTKYMDGLVWVDQMTIIKTEKIHNWDETV